MKKSISSVAMISALALAAPAFADCPVSMADAADGVHVTFTDFHVRFERQADGSVIEEEDYFSDGSGFRVHSMHGAYVLQSWDTMHGAVVNGTSEITEYSNGMSDLLLMGPGQSHVVQAVRTHDDGTVNVESIGVSVQPAITLTLGNCTMQAWPMIVTTTNSADGGAFVDELTYLPNLGFAIYHGGASQGEAFTRDEPIGISTEPPFTDGNGSLSIEPPLATPAPGNPAPAPTPGGGNK